jgi:hypothetical protein
MLAPTLSQRLDALRANQKTHWIIVQNDDGRFAAAQCGQGLVRETTFTAQTLSALREKLPRGLIRLAPDADGGDLVVERWA